MSYLVTYTQGNNWRSEGYRHTLEQTIGFKTSEEVKKWILANKIHNSVTSYHGNVRPEADRKIIQITCRGQDVTDYFKETTQEDHKTIMKEAALIGLKDHIKRELKSKPEEVRKILASIEAEQGEDNELSE